jgi:hypothetical protein
MKENKSSKKKIWWLEGLIWGAFMFVMMEILFRWVEKEPFTTKRMLYAAVYWLVGGLIYGFVMKLLTDYSNKKMKKRREAEQ